MLAALSPAKFLGGFGLLVDPRRRAYALMQFKAWWEGEEFDPDAANAELNLRFGDKPTEYKDVESDEAPAKERNIDIWKPKLQSMHNRLQVSELLWGPGYVGPGDKDWHEQLGQTLNVNSENSLAIIGGGLAGPAREISEDTGVWTTVFERISDVAEAARKQNEGTPAGKKITVESFDPLTIDLPQEKFHGLITLFEAHRIPDKAALIAAGAASIQSKAPFLLIDYVLGSGEPNVKETFMGYWGPTELWTEDQYKEEMENNDIDVRVNEDITEPVLGYIGKAWADWEEVIKKIETFDVDEEERGALIRILGEEAEMWTARQTALKERSLRVVRLFGLKKK